MTKRLADIREKLDFILEKYESLDSELKEATTKGADIKNLGIKVGEILGGCRECLDYCVNDIVETLLPSYSIKKPKERFYFPFSTRRLTGNSGVFKEIQKQEKEKFESLLGIIKKIETGATLDGLGIHYNYSLIKLVNDLVNKKKHNKITETKHMEEAKTLVEFPSGIKAKLSAYTINDDGYKIIPSAPILTDKSASKRLIREYFIGDHEVDRICECSIKATAHIISEAYESILEIDDPEVNPWELRKTKDDRLADRSLKKRLPIAYSPIVTGLYDNETSIITVRNTFDGKHLETPKENHGISNFLRELFYRSLAPSVDAKFRNHIRENWREVADQEEETVSVFESHIESKEHIKVILENNKEYKFNKIVFGIQFKFNTQYRPSLLLRNNQRDQIECLLKALNSPPLTIKLLPSEHGGLNFISYGDTK